MSAVVIWVIAAVAVVVAIVIVAVVVLQKRGKAPEPTLDPPYGRTDVPDPTAGDPQVIHETDPAEMRYPDGPDNIRNPNIDNTEPGATTPRNFPHPGPPVQ